MCRRRLEYLCSSAQVSGYLVVDHARLEHSYWLAVFFAVVSGCCCNLSAKKFAYQNSKRHLFQRESVCLPASRGARTQGWSVGWLIRLLGSTRLLLATLSGRVSAVNCLCGSALHLRLMSINYAAVGALRAVQRQLQRQRQQQQ